MPIHPILSLHKERTIRLDPQAVIERPEAAAWVMQCIANWSWVESATGTLFVNLLGTNLPAGAALYSDMTSALAKDRALRSVALAALPSEGYAILEALLKAMNARQKTRDKYAHWYWGVCEEMSDGLVLVDPRNLMRRRARLLAYDKGRPKIPPDVYPDASMVYAARVSDLKLDAADFSEFAKLVFAFANYAAEKNPEQRALQLHKLSRDARIRAVLDQDGRSEMKKNSSSSSITAKYTE